MIHPKTKFTINRLKNKGYKVFSEQEWEQWIKFVNELILSRNTCIQWIKNRQERIKESEGNRYPDGCYLDGRCS